MIKKLIILFEVLFIGGVAYTLYTSYNKAQKGMVVSNALSYLDAVEKQAILNDMDLDQSNDLTNGTFNVNEHHVKYYGNKPISGIFVTDNNNVKKALLQYEVYGNKQYVCFDNQKTGVYTKIVENNNCFDLYNQLEK